MKSPFQFAIGLWILSTSTAFIITSAINHAPWWLVILHTALALGGSLQIAYSLESRNDR